MVKVAYLLLCHKNAKSVIAQARALADAGDVVAIHFDKRGSDAAFAELREAFAGDDRVAFAKRVACGWGEYSLVQASINMMRAARKSFRDVTHYYMISGDCFPTKTSAYLKRALAAGDRDWIEIHHFMESDWIKTGLKEDRLIYRHVVNERKRKQLFYALLNLQRRLGLKRKIPDGLTVRIGSQWCLLRASTVEKIFAFMKKRPEVVRFFKTTWIPDEIMFQTIVAHVVPHEQIVCQPPTTLVFTDYGIPVVFHADHKDMLLREPRFFARKLTEHNQGFREDLLAHYSTGEDVETGREMVRPYYEYLASRGRHGRRHVPRFWQRSTQLDDSKEVLVIACKKWHVGEQFARVVNRVSGVDSLGYVFDQDQPLNMELGNLEVGKDKRGRHRRAFLSLLFQSRGVSKLAICVDPSRDDVVRDFAETDCRMRVLLIDTDFDEHDLCGHAERVGLLAPAADGQARRAVVDALTVEFAEESGRLRKVGTGRMDRLGADQNRVEKAAAVARFLRIGRDEVEAVVREVEPLL